MVPFQLRPTLRYNSHLSILRLSLSLSVSRSLSIYLSIFLSLSRSQALFLSLVGLIPCRLFSKHPTASYRSWIEEEGISESFTCTIFRETEGKMVLSKVPGRQADSDEAQGAVPQGAREIQQGEGGQTQIRRDSDIETPNHARQEQYQWFPLI